MSIWGLVGASLGLAIAVLGNIFVYPFVAKRREARFASTYASMPVETAAKRRNMAQTMAKVQYRVVMPVLFAGMGYVFGNQLLGAN